MKFSHYLFHNKTNRNTILLSVLASIILFSFFKVLYPYANFMPDSYSYIEAARTNTNINVWPVGYSKFLRIFSAFTHSDTVLVFFQYLLLQISLLLFLFTVVYLLPPARTVKYVLLAYLVINPVSLVLSNYISADALFAALSLLWITTLLWLLLKPDNKIIWLHALILLLCYTLRHNALYYPIISIIVFIVSKLSLKQKSIAITISFIVIGLYTWHTGNQYKNLTGKRQFSAFGEWQLAANAIYAYSQVPEKEHPSVPAQFKALHSVVRQHLDSLNHLKIRPDSGIGLYYLWEGPLVQFFKMEYGKDTATPYIKKYASIAPLYAAYGNYLIKEYPQAFVRNFILPNTMKYYVPPAEFLNQYNMYRDTVSPVAQNWFGYKSPKVKSYSKRLDFLNWLSATFGIINLLFLVVFIGFCVIKEMRQQKEANQCIQLFFLVFIVNLGFSVLASPVVLRYQLFPTILSFTSATLLITRVIQLTKATPSVTAAVTA